MSAASLTVAAGAGVAAGLCSAADGALRAAERMSGIEGPTIGESMGSRDRQHRALLLARFVLFLLVGAAAEWGATGTGATRVAIRLAVAFVVAAVAEALARAAGDAAGPAARVAFARLPRALEFLLTPVVALTIWIDGCFERLLPPAPRRAEERETAEAQFRQVVAAEAEATSDEQELLTGVFSLGDTAVSEIMVPRVAILGIPRDAPWSQVLDRVRSAGHARLPVYDESIDEIVGILYAKDLLPAVVAGEPPAAGWTALVRPATFIPPTKAVDAQLRDFKASGAHIAIVTDEFGGTAGLVTIEDVLEEIVGDIRDERDREEPDVEREGERRWWVSGRVTLNELSELVGHDFAHDEVSTVGGLVYELLGRVPNAGERLMVDNFRFVVERVRQRTIERVYVERLAPLATRRNA